MVAEESDESAGFFGRLSDAIGRKRDLLLRRRLELTPFEYDEVVEMAENARGDSVTPERVGRVAKHLDPDEQPHYFLTGGSYFGLRIEGGTTEVRKGAKGKGPLGTFNNLRGTIVAVTDERVLIVARQTTGDDVHSVPHDAITGVDSARGFPAKITVQTHGRTYHVEIAPGDDGLEEVLGYVRERRTIGTRSDTTSDRPADPLERIERLADLRDRGLLTDEEFEAKKRALLDDV